MPRDFSMDTVGGMLDDLKSRLGFSQGEGRTSSRGADDYDDYGEYGLDDYDFDEYGDYGEGSSAGSVGGFKSASPYAPRTGSSPNLVSFDDVKYSTPMPDLPEPASSAPAARTTGAYSSTSNVGGHTVIDATVPHPESPAYKAAVRDGVGTRALTVIKPVVYGDVERVARAVRQGDVVVLAMRNTPDNLYGRILDFSFGVASALEANVESPAERVFAIARGAGLSADEKERLRAQGVL